MGLASFIVIITINFRVGHTEMGYPFYIDHVPENGGVSECYTGKKTKESPGIILGGIPLYIRIYDLMLYLVLLSIFSKSLIN